MHQRCGNRNEALRVLSTEGFVRMQPNWGTFVAELSPDEAEHLLEVRARLEPLAAYRAATNRSDSQLAELRGILAEGLAAAHAKNHGLASILNGRFHEALAEASGNTTLVDLIRLLRDKINWVYSAEVERRAVDSWNEHAELVEAISVGNAKRAEQIIGLHIDRATDALQYRQAPR